MDRPRRVGGKFYVSPFVGLVRAIGSIPTLEQLMKDRTPVLSGAHIRIHPQIFVFLLENIGNSCRL
jgi:hypothetical protein